ncbi:MAG TPA: protein kinase [Myxococcota bacterium]|nr:protein kinase [Myxococcota bacterium]
MEINCSSCGRHFDVDGERTPLPKVVRCVCGARLRLTRDASGTGPQRLGKYQLARRIAVGGMGEIFYAKAGGIEGFEREVAIKKMLPHLAADRAFIDMMVKEAKLTVLLNHPNIVQVYDLAREGSDYYIAMEFVPGTNVGHLLEVCYNNGVRLPVDVAVFITMQVLKGLAYAHDLRDAGGEPMHILHLDITPQNILVTPDAWVKITDFGIAKARNEISTTSPGMIKGKLGYIAPEQLSGRAPDQRVDIFCAGILLWESLAARRLFKGVDEVDTFRLIAEARIPPLGAIRNDVSPGIEKTLHKGLAREPDARYAKADDFYNGLVQAIYPRTVDELGRAARTYFHEHPEFFDEAVKASERAPTPVDARDSAIPDDQLQPIGDFLERPRGAPAPTGKRRMWPIVALAAVATIAVGLVAGWPLIAEEVARRTGTPTAAVVTQPPTQAAPTPADPRLTPLTTAEVELAIKGETTRIRECYCAAVKELKAVEQLSAKVAIVSTGGVVSVALTPAAEKLGRAGGCVQDVLTEMLFRPTATPVFETVVSLPQPKSMECGGDDPAPRPAGRETPLTGPEIQAVVQRSSQQIAQCLQKFEGAKAPAKVDARLTIEPTGRVSNVSLAPAVEVEVVSRCLDKTLRSLRFHRHPQKDFQVTIPLKIQQVL